MWITIIIVVVIIGMGTYVWFHRDAFSGLFGTAEEEPAPPEPVVPTVRTYASSTMGISFEYAPDFTLNEQYAYTGFPSKPIQGVSVTIPFAMATGTNLSADTYLAVEQLPRANNCSGDIFVTANVRASELTENGVAYSVATSSEGAAGNRYEETVYALKDSKPCTALRYVIHYSEIANYEPGAVREFDKTAILREFDTIRRTLLVVPQ
jgi:hypothetical protein